MLLIYDWLKSNVHDISQCGMGKRKLAKLFYFSKLCRITNNMFRSVLEGTLAYKVGDDSQWCAKYPLPPYARYNTDNGTGGLPAHKFFGFFLHCNPNAQQVGIYRDPDHTPKLREAATKARDAYEQNILRLKSMNYETRADAEKQHPILKKALDDAEKAAWGSLYKFQSCDRGAGQHNFGPNLLVSKGWMWVDDYIADLSADEW